MTTKHAIAPTLLIWLLASLGLLESCSNPDDNPINPAKTLDPPTIQISKLDFGELVSQTATEAFVTVLRRKIQVDSYVYYSPLGITYAIDIPNGISGVTTSDDTPFSKPDLSFTRGETKILLTWYPGIIQTGRPVILTVTDRSSKSATFTIYPTYEVTLNPSDVVEALWEKTTFEGSVDYCHRPDLFATADKSLLALTEGHLYKSSDKGATWEEITDSGIDFVSTVALHPSGTLYAGSRNDSKLAKSTDNGDTWLPLKTNLPPASEWAKGIESMSISGDGIFQLSLVPAVWRSQDGESWTRSESDLAGYNYEIPFMVALNESTTLAFGHEGGWNWQCMIRSSDSGKTWKCLDVSKNAWFTDILYASNGKVYASAEHGIYKSEDLGETWTRSIAGIPLGFQNVINTIIEGADGKIYAAPLNYGVFRLEGDTWKSVGTDLATFNVTNLVAIDGDVYAAVEPCSLYRLN